MLPLTLPFYRISPFGERCNCIHDPRVQSDKPSWLPHSDVPVANLPQTTVNVEKFFHQQLNSLTQENPLVHDPIWNTRLSLKNKSFDEADGITEWKETYAFVCNMHRFGAKRKNNLYTPSKNINELQRLIISYLTSYTSPLKENAHHIGYAYKPQQIVYDELCMTVSFFGFIHYDIVKHLLVLNTKST